MARDRVQEFSRPDWEALPREGCVAVFGRVLSVSKTLVVANLRFLKYATTDEHDALHEIEVFCLSGHGFVSVGAAVSEITEGQRIVWPVRKVHRLWTEDSLMETLMVEYLDRHE